MKRFASTAVKRLAPTGQRLSTVAARVAWQLTVPSIGLSLQSAIASGAALGSILSVAMLSIIATLASKRLIVLVRVREGRQYSNAKSAVSAICGVD